MIQKMKGTYDIYGKEGKRYLYLMDMLADLMAVYHYQYIKVPLFEASEVFHRGVGETTDIVTKETYDFEDRGGRAITLRPEITAGIVRSFIENKMYGNATQPVKLYSYGEAFRYERPQSGRNRQLHQIDVEVFGSNSPLLDAEVISIPVTFLRLLGLKGIKVHVNSLGDTESRLAYKQALLDYLAPHISDMCEDCQSRYLKNPLRILDCKVDAEKEVLKNVPKMQEYWNEDSKTHFEQVLTYLDALGIEYIVDPKLVRGLDYYTNTVFEIEADIKGFGAQNVLCGGGRYNGLVETLDGPATPGIGFAIGVERLLLALAAEEIQFPDEDEVDLYVISLDTPKETLELVHMLRVNGFVTEMDYLDKSMKNQFKQAERYQANYVLIVGEEEVATKTVKVKDQETHEEKRVAIDDLVAYLDEKMEDCHEEHTE